LTMRVWLAALFVASTPIIAAAQLPTPGSTYHLLFASQERVRTTTSPSVPPAFGRFGGIDAADWQVTNAAFSASLPGTLGWDGVAPLYRSILSISGDNAVSRLSTVVGGPVYNLHGELLAAGHADLFDGNLGAAVGYDEYGAAIMENLQIWTGSNSTGVWAGTSCGAWNNTSSMSGGRIGSVSDSSSNWLSMGINKNCNETARLYGVSHALTAPLWGDYDASGAVDGGDFLEWQRQSGQAPSAAFAAARAFTANAAQSPIVNMADLAVWRDYLGETLPPAAPVPEPGAWGMLLAGVAVCWRRRGGGA
jgi:hypothetical protein